MARRRRRRRRWTILDVAALAVLAYYGVMAWHVRQIGLRVEAARAAGSLQPSANLGTCLRIMARVAAARDTQMELRLYRRVGGVHLLEHRTRVCVRRGWLFYVYPAAEKNVVYRAVLIDDAGRWGRLDVALAPSTETQAAQLVLYPGPAPWFL